MYLPSAVTKQAEIDAAIAHVQESAGPDVARIRYEIGEDWSGQWAIFFRIARPFGAAQGRPRPPGHRRRYLRRFLKVRHKDAKT